MNIGDIRQEYTQSGLERSNLNHNPLKQFELWFEQARAAELPEVNAMSIATVTADDMPQVRTVLLKQFDAKGFVFFTNYNSAKAAEINANPKTSILFPWLALERQVRISGAIEKINQADSFAYFNSRPRGSQLGAWVSAQSQVIADRSALSKRLEEIELKFQGGEVPLPDDWGGYRIIPSSYEFWQGRASRLHDRFKYTLCSNDEWQIDRLAP